MRLALAAALLTVCLTGQGCLSFFALGPTYTLEGKKRRSTCIVTGILRGCEKIPGFSHARDFSPSSQFLGGRCPPRPP